MMKEEDIARFDQNRLYYAYTQWPSYFTESLNLHPHPDHEPEYYKYLIFCGVGGSATSSDVLQEMINTSGIIPCMNLRGQPMPSFVDKRTLVIVNSVSGNTAESLLMMKDALSHNAEVIAISSGGKLKEQASSNSCKHIQIPNLSLPRASLPYLLVPGLRLINGFLKKSIDNELNEASGVAKSILDRNCGEAPEEYNLANRIARFTIGGFPVCYSSPFLFPAATRFKASMNENAKLHCLRESILEASHNDIVPFTFNHSTLFPRVLHLRWTYDEKITSERFDKVISLFQKVVQDSMEIKIEESSLLHSLISAIYVMDLATIYVAIARNTDPSPTPAIQILKDI
jgi:glucose/mannose-6-phosphate isomerase